jgi:AcrR family transcriptional regulator
MTPPAATKRTLSTADERREDVLEAAMGVFAERGYLGTPTMAIAKAAGISQAYLFRLFPTKEELVLAVVHRSNERIHATFAQAAAQAKARGEDPLTAMGASYSGLVTDRELLLSQLHAHAAASSMPAVAQAVRECFQKLVELAERETGEDPATLQAFFAHGMLMNVMAAADAPGRSDRWAQILTADDGLCRP